MNKLVARVYKTIILRNKNDMIPTILGKDTRHPQNNSATKRYCTSLVARVNGLLLINTSTIHHTNCNSSLLRLFHTTSHHTTPLPIPTVSSSSLNSSSIRSSTNSIHPPPPPSGPHLVDSKGGVDARAVNGLALLVQPPHRGPHPLGAHRHHVDVIRELLPESVEVAQQEPVGQAQGSALSSSF